MYKRKFKKANEEVSTLGFGAMRLPVTDPDDSGTINKEEAGKMIRYAIDHGVSYIDTAYPYHNKQSEKFIGEVLKDGYREKVHLTSKLPCWSIKEYKDFEKIFEEQINKLDVEFLDFYLLHAMHKKTWDNVKNLGVLSFLDQLKEQGKIRFAGFSFHDNLDTFKEIIDSYNWDVCQIQFNYFDREAKEYLDYASNKGVDVIVMEPLRGGGLVNELPEEILELYNNAPVKRNLAEWAFRWLYNHPGIKVILSGMSTMDQVKDNIRIFENAKENSMSEEELEIVDKAYAIFKDRILVPCTSCRYCMPCPSGVRIPLMFDNYNTYSMFGNNEKYIRRYREWKKEADKFTADQCIGCRVCEEKCPQSIIISERMKDIERIMG